MSFSRESSEHSPGPPGQRPSASFANSSRNGSIASLWSSADVPLFLDAHRSSEAARTYSHGFLRQGSDGNGASSESRWAASPVPRSSHPQSGGSGHKGSDDNPSWPLSAIPAGPMSPRPSVDSAAYSLPRVSIASRPSIDAAYVPSPNPQSTSSIHLRSDSVGSSPRGFQNRKPATLHIQPVAYSSPLRSKASQATTTTTTHPSPGALSTISPSLATSPTYSQETDASADLPTPLTYKSTASKSRKSRKEPTDALYAKAGQFFSVDYTMSTPPQTAHDFRPDDGNFTLQRQVESAAPDSVGRSDEPEDQPRAIAQQAPRDAARSPVSSRNLGDGGPPGSIWHVPTRQRILGSKSEHSSPAGHLAALPDSPSRARTPTTSRGSPLQPAIRLGERMRTPSSSQASGKTNELESSSEHHASGAGLRGRTHSVPRLHSDWLKAQGTRLPFRKASFCPGALPRSPNASAVGLSIDQSRSSSAEVDTSAVSVSSTGDAPQSPRSRLFRQTSRVGTPTGRPATQRSRNASNASLTQSLFKAPKSPSRPKSKAGWSSHLSEGLTLYLDQAGKQERAIKMPYLSYDPFGNPESLAAQSMSPGPQQPSTPKKNRLRPSSSRDTVENEVGILNFARAAGMEPASPILLSLKDSAPVLRHLGIGEDTQADLLTRQATLSLSENGVHQVSGSENNGRTAWSFKYEVADAPADTHWDGYKALTPLSLQCSASLLDPSRARKARLLKLVKKGVSANLTSALVEGSPRRAAEHDRSISVIASADAVSRPQLQQSCQVVQSRALEESSSGSTPQHTEWRRPSTATDASNGSVIRLDPSSAPIPANLPASVVPFKLRSSISKGTTVPRMLPVPQDAYGIGDASERVFENNTQSPNAPTFQRTAAVFELVSPQDLAASKTAMGTSAAMTRPRTAAEEIKMQYLQRTPSDHSLQVVDPGNRPADKRRPSSAREAATKAQDSPASSASTKLPTLHEAQSFAAIRTQSRQHLRKAISTKALPKMPPRPITAQNLSAAGPQASASLLVEMGFI